MSATKRWMFQGRAARRGAVAVMVAGVTTACVVDIPDVKPEARNGAADAATPDATIAPDAGPSADAAGGGGDDAQPVVDAAPSDAPAEGSPGTVDGGDAATCADTQGDSANCGRCGHSCLGGACTAGVCQPLTLVSNQGNPHCVAVDDTSIYWTDRLGGIVTKASKLQPGGIVTLASGSGGGAVHPTVLAVDGDAVYWIDDNYSNSSVRRCPKSGCAGVGKLLATADYPGGLALDETHVYYSHWQDGSIWSVPKQGDAGAPLAVAKTPGYALRVAVDDTYVYWTDNYNAATGKRVSRAAKGGPVAQTPFPIALDQSQPIGIAIHGTDVFWANDTSAGGIRTAPRTGVPDGGTYSSVGGAQPNPLDLALTATRVYWIDQGPETYNEAGTEYHYEHGSIRSCDLPACSGGVKVLAIDQYEPFGIAVDDAAVYWTTIGDVRGGSGAIQKLAF